MGRETFEYTFAKDNTEENMKAYLAKSFNTEKVKEEIIEMDSQFFLALLGDVPVGYARMRKNNELDEFSGSAVELERIYVIRKVLGKKIGAALLQACLEYAQQKGFAWVWLGVWEHNKKAQQFYSKWGFKKFGEKPFQLGDDPQVDWLMKKRIRNSI